MIYNLIIALYTSAVRLAALFNKKVALMVKGEKESFDILQKKPHRLQKNALRPENFRPFS